MTAPLLFKGFFFLLTFKILDDMFNTTSRTSKHADKAAVKKSAELLMMINGETTTLEVKKILRLEGYIAYQAKVSELMDIIAAETQWPFTCNGVYRTYTFQLNMNYQIDPKVPSFGYN